MNEESGRDIAATLRHGGRPRRLLRLLSPAPVRRAAHWVWNQLVKLQLTVFQRRYRVDVSGPISLVALGVDAAGRVLYDPVHPIPLRRTLAAMRAGPADVVCDLGAGKGAALIVAATFPVSRVIGVEVSEQLAAVARRNVERAGDRLRARQTEVITADAVDWSPPDDLTVALMYCPFTGEVFGRVVEHLLSLVDRRARPLRLVYVFPAEHNALLATERIELVDVHPAQWPAPPWWPWSGWVITTYSLLPSGTPAGHPAVQGGPLRRAAIRRWRAQTDQEFTLFAPPSRPPRGGPHR
jgi:hypothetical protein